MTVASDERAPTADVAPINSAAAGLRIRRAGPEDAQELAALIGELATEEGLTEELSAKASDFATAIAREPPACRFTIAEWNGVVGFCAAYPAFSTFLGKSTMFVEDIFVRPAARRRGVGSALLAEVCDHALGQGMGRVEWRVQSVNHAAIAQFDRAGISANCDWKFCRLTLREMETFSRPSPAATSGWDREPPAPDGNLQPKEVRIPQS